MWSVDASRGVSGKRYRYTGMERDDETGLGYHSQRYYCPWLGRWTRPDPIGVRGGVNLWAYGSGDPVGRHDRVGTIDSRLDLDIQRDEKAVLAGQMTAAEYGERSAARAAGGTAGAVLSATGRRLVGQVGPAIAAADATLTAIETGIPAAEVVVGEKAAEAGLAAALARAAPYVRAAVRLASPLVAPAVDAGRTLAAKARRVFRTSDGAQAPDAALRGARRSPGGSPSTSTLPEAEEVAPSLRPPRGQFEVRLGTGATLTASIDGDVLEIGMILVPPDVQRTGQSKELLKQALDAAGDVTAIRGELSFTNEMIYQDLLAEGLSPDQAVRSTPAARIRVEAGFGRLEFDPETMVLTGHRD